MPLLVREPDHFQLRPEALGFTQLLGTHIQLDRTTVKSDQFVLTDQNKVMLRFNQVNWSQLKTVLRFDIRQLAPSFNTRVYLWVSDEPNGQPIGSKVLGNICTAPILWDLQRDDTTITFSTKGTDRPLLRLDPGTYWMNLFYYGSSKHTIINPAISVVG